MKLKFQRAIFELLASRALMSSISRLEIPPVFLLAIVLPFFGS